MKVRSAENEYAYGIRAGLNIADFGVVLGSPLGQSDHFQHHLAEASAVGHGLSAMRNAIMAATDGPGSPACPTHVVQGIGDAISTAGSVMCLTGVAPLASLLTLMTGDFVSNIGMCANANR